MKVTGGDEGFLGRRQRFCEGLKDGDNALAEGVGGVWVL